jgi:hypothetical protein
MSRMTRSRPMLLVLCLLAGGWQSLQGQNNELRLKRAWVEKFADRATMDVSMTVRHTHKAANTVGEKSQDGDIHFSGESDDVGLPFVGEVVNAGLAANKPVIAMIKAKEVSGETLDLRGAWRIWFEHPAKLQVQGGQNAFHPDHTNPDHLFEIHPASQVDEMDLKGSFIRIPGYTAYAADVAFPRYEKVEVTIKASASGISIRATKLGYNYVEFEAELTHKPKQVEDGLIALAKVFGESQEEEITSSPRRLIIVKDTPAASAFAAASAGDRFTVLGIPRFNLNAVLALVKQNGTSQFQAALPYEIIVVGVR